MEAGPLRPESTFLDFARVIAMLTVGIATYDEEDDGFMFKRVNKRSKPEEPVTTTGPAPAATQKPATTAKRNRKDNKNGEDEAAPPAKKPRGRTMNFSTPSGKDETKVSKQRGTRKSTRLSTNDEGNNNAQATEMTDDDAIDLVGQTEPDRTVVDSGTQSTVIQLPFSDTPVINRNKELRKKQSGARRSSLGLRGRRASSLIDNGHSALPHSEVQTAEFYKHIEAEGLTEPRRMKQLLTWAGERALGDRPSHMGDPDSAASLAGKMSEKQVE